MLSVSGGTIGSSDYSGSLLVDSRTVDTFDPPYYLDASQGPEMVVDDARGGQGACNELTQ